MDTIIRVQKNHDADPFARIDKIPINDESLSFKSKGILVYVLSKPDGWNVNIKDLDNHATDKEKSIRAGIAELEALKYVRRYKVIHAINKRVLKYVYQFYERPYPGPQIDLTVIETEPLSQKGEVETEPLSLNRHADKRHAENRHAEKVPPINKVFKQLTNIIINDSNNNSDHTGKGAAAVVVIPKKDLKEYSLIAKRIKKIGWVGNMEPIKKYYLDDKNYLIGHLEKIEKIAATLTNPAGLFRKNLNSGEKILTANETEAAALAELGLTPEEIEGLI